MIISRYCFACALFLSLMATAFTVPLTAGDVCSVLETRLCLGEGDRFSIEVEFSNFAGNPLSQAPADAQGPGQAGEFDTDTGFFWFVDEQDLSLIIKVLDARNINGHFWVFFATTSNFEFEVTVRDEETDREVVYLNPAGQFTSTTDTVAFESPPPASTPASSSGQSLDGFLSPVRHGFRDDTADGGTVGGQAVALLANAMLTEYSAGEAPDRAAIDHGTALPFPLPLVEPTGTACVPDQRTLCLLEGRFQVRANWELLTGDRGAAGPQALSDRSGGLAFFSNQRFEILVRVEDGRESNGNFWFFIGSISGAAYEITVIDTLTGRSRIFSNNFTETRSRGTNALFAPPRHLAQFGGGAGFSTRFILFNLSSDLPAKVELHLFSDQGAPILTPPSQAPLLPLDEGVVIPPGGSITLGTSPEGDEIFLGSVTAMSDRPLGAQARYALGAGSAAVDGGQILRRGRVPVRQSAQLGLSTGLALRNTTTTPLDVRLGVLDLEGVPVPGAEAELMIVGNQRVSHFIHELFSLPEEFEGTVTIETDVHALAVIALELGSTPGDFTSISPVAVP